MMSAASSRGSATTGIANRSGYLLLVLLALLMATVVGFAIWSSAQTDRTVVARQTETFDHSIDHVGEDKARDLEGISSVDVFLSAALDLPDPQATAMLDLFAAALANFGFDAGFILHPSDTPIYASAARERIDPTTYDSVAPELESFMQDLAAAPIGPLGGKAVLTDVAVVDGRPALVSATAMTDPSGTVPVDAGAEPTVLAVQFLDGPFLEHLAEEHLIDDARFVPVGSESSAAALLPLTNRNGETLGYMGFTPFRPGANLLSAVGPWAALAAAAAAAITLWLLFRWRSATRRALHSEAETQHLAFHDPLTGLPNRALFNDRLDQALARVRRDGHATALLYLDIDRFKVVNDTLGHPAGDELIRQVGERLGSHLSETDTLARLGGDEFGVIYADLVTPAELEVQCLKMIEHINRPFHLAEGDSFVGISIGVAIAPAAGTQRSDLVRKADIALYRAKHEGRNCMRVFHQEMDRSLQEKRIIEAALRVALEQGDQLEIYYQPLCATGTRQIVGVEALVRWHHAVLGTLPPAQFIPIAEESGLIHPLGEWVLRTACRTAADWPVDRLAVNISPVQFRSAGFADQVLAILRETGFDPRRLELEVTESVLVEGATEALRKLRGAGIRIALDDFGTGYSSLSYLGRYGVDKIKIDRSFVSAVDQNSDAQAIVIAIVELARAMGIEVTAEGVETSEQSRFLAGIGCDQMQGYLFSHAVPAPAIQDILFRRTAEKLREAAEAEPISTALRA